MMYLGDFPADQAIYFVWDTNDSDGASITRSGDGTISVYKDNSDGSSFNQTQVTTGVTNDEDMDTLTGIHSCCITTTDAWYETGHDYIVVLSAATIDTQTVNTILAHFSIENRFMRGTNSAALAVNALSDTTWTDAKAGYLDAAISSRNATTPPTVTAIRQEMDTNSTKMAPSQVLADYKATGFSTHSAANVWSVGTRALTDKSGFALSTAGIDALWDDLISGMTAVGSIGKLLADNLNATITSRAPSGEYNTQMGYIPSDLGSVPIASELNSDHGAGSWATAVGFSTHSAANVWAVGTRALTDKSGFALSQAGIDLIWDDLTSGITQVGSIGKLIADNLNATMTSRAPSGEYNTEMARLDVDVSTRAILDEYDADFEDVKALLGNVGDIFYVSKSGSNGDGTTWATAKTTIDAAIALCTANNGDMIYIDAGTYDENAGGIAGVTCDVEGIWIRGIVPGVLVKNTNTTNAGKVFTITATNTLISDVGVDKGETTSDNSIVIDVNGSNVVADVRNTTIAVEKSTHTGMRFTGGALSCSYMDDDLHLSHIYSNAGVGTGIEFGNCVGCIVVDPQIHDLTTGMKFTGGANCHHNTVSPNTVIASCDTGISLSADAWSNILSALILNCTTHYIDNSGVTTNDTDGSLTFVLDDINASIVEAAPQTHLATSDSTVTYGTIDSGTYADTNTDNDVYWQISPDAVNAIDMYSQFLIGVGRVPNAVDFNGRFVGSPRYCEVDAWNYDTAAWETISSDSNRIGHAANDYDRQFALTPSHVKATDGEMKIRVRSTSTTIGDDLYIDKLVIASVAEAAGGLTADAVATTVWNRNTDTFTGASTAGSRLRRIVAIGTEVSVSNTATSFTVSSGETEAEAYKDMFVRVGCTGTDYCETRRITDWTAGRVMTVDRAFSSVPQVGDLVRVLNQYGGVEVGDKTEFSLSDAGIDAILDENIEGTHTFREILRLIAAATVGKSSGGGTTTLTFRDIDDTKDRIVATVTTVGNRTAMTLTED